MGGLTLRQVAEQRLARGGITQKQYNLLRDRFFPEATPQVPPTEARAYVHVPAHSLLLINPELLPEQVQRQATEQRASMTPEQRLADYVSNHPTTK